MTPFIPLIDADATCGTKAQNLGRLTRAGFSVPNGVALPCTGIDNWEAALPQAMRTLDGAFFAVRSSGIAEDSPDTSFAGQFHTRLNVPRQAIAHEVRQIAARVEDARDYASAMDHPAPRSIGVVIQEMVTPSAAGVAFTRHPVTGEDITVIEAVRGLGDQLVSGQAQPERWQLTQAGPIATDSRDILMPAQVLEIGRVATRVEELLGDGQDIEWAIADDHVWVLQSRPITTSGRPSSAASPSVGLPAGQKFLAAGTPSSPGVARGRARYINSLDDFSQFQPGEILVCQATSPAWTPLLARARAVVTTRGGILSHAAIVAREFRIPAITGVQQASTIPDGHCVTVNGDTGTIISTTEIK